MAPGINRADDGNISIDFLMGLLVFVMAFAYIMTAIPGMFVPYQSTSIDLGSVVYRTSSILVEDPGWYKNGDTSYSNWEQDNNMAYVTRVGLAIDKRSPNVLSMDKIMAMQNLQYLTIRDKMGLNNTVMYNFSLSLKEMKGSDPSGVEILNFSNPYHSGIVESMDRIVHIREGEGILINAPQYIDGLYPTQNYTVINHNPSLSGNISIRIEGLNETGTEILPETPFPVTVSFYYDDAHDQDDWGHFNQLGDYSRHDYYIYKNGVYLNDIENAEYDPGDIIDVVVDTNRIYNQYFSSIPGMNFSTVRVNTASVKSCFPRTCVFYNITNPLYHYYDTDGIMTLRVWQT